MKTIKAKKPYSLEFKSDHVIAHYSPTKKLSSVGTDLIKILAVFWFLGGWFPCFALFLYALNSSTLFWFAYIGVFLGLLWWHNKFVKPVNAKGSPAKTIVFHRDRLDAPCWPTHNSFDRADIGTVHSITPDSSFTYKASNYKVKKALAEHKAEISHAVTADYGTNEITIVSDCLTEQQAVAIRDLVGKWRDNPERFLQNPDEIAA